MVPPSPTLGGQKSVTKRELAYFGPEGGKSTLEKQKTASKHNVMKISKNHEFGRNSFISDP